MSSKDGLVKMKIDVFPNGKEIIDENYVSVFAKLLTTTKKCYASSFKFSISNSRKILQNEEFSYYYWQENDLSFGYPRFISRQKCSDMKEDMLHGDTLNILVNIFCMALVKHTSKRSIIPATVNTVEMTYVWNICNLNTYPDVRSASIISVLFPSKGEVVKFYLELQPRGEVRSTDGFISLLSCVEGPYDSGPSLTVNFSLTIRDFGNDDEIVNYNTASVFYDVKTNRCWGSINALLLEKAINKPCLTIEYRGIYAV